MILASVLLASMTVSSVHPSMNAASALAPFPLYFTPEGNTKYEIVEIDGEKYVIGWDKGGNFATFKKLSEIKGFGKRPDWFFWSSLVVAIGLWLHILLRFVLKIWPSG